ncbi:T9SS type A sorting domain-containing protein [Winogradskyella jejuensis]|uniref:Por secretion system C-terminal sorting domain-containing protein n=1 Tax=Winogradskyella jejuensis TaxID=1089305 RepID=A0A1M5MEG9_9FLAO|nr:T9SS type A sorting domain-containing protein [Winogradskyella jejuensis]SHG75113.1 Por secretion system C-terminal sorting domain-containing protein [Winogradskyella jejuensis]
MKTRLLIFTVAFFVSLSSISQNLECNAITVDDFFDCYGGAEAFSEQSRNALTTFIQAEDAINTGDYPGAKLLIDNIFETYPKGTNIWLDVLGAPNGANIGSPNTYYGLRMIEDIVDFQLNNTQDITPETVVMKIVLVGCSQGIQPTTVEELNTGTGPYVTNTIAQELIADDYRIVRQSFSLFSQYVTAITGGSLNIEIEIIELPDVCMDLSITSSEPYITSRNEEPVYAAFSDEELNSTDWWWILYPSYVPENDVFDDYTFITGGMGQDERSGPAFVIDDKWLVRKPAHLGSGLYSDIERRAYLPQWLQHEFFHHLYRKYPHLQLEVNGHDWFNPDFWPSDFEGIFEPDFYAESLYKRLQVDCSPLSSKLITRVQDEELAQLDLLSISDLQGGIFSLDEITNDFHIGEIILEDGRYFWKNAAGFQWEVFPDFQAGILETGEDSLYPGEDFFIELYKTTDGEYFPAVSALKFQNEFYRRRFDLFRDIVPVEIAVGNYTRVPVETSADEGQVIKNSGQFLWQDNAANSWSLTVDIDGEALIHGNDAPQPSGEFKLIIKEDECGVNVLGFEYLGYYYWKPKRNIQNESPIVSTQLEDLELNEDFGSLIIDLLPVFSDSENDQLLYFVTSDNPEIIGATIEDNQLVITSNQSGTARLYVMALDGNGGIATQEFRVGAGVALSIVDDFELSEVSIYPNPIQDTFTIHRANTNISQAEIYNINGALVKTIDANNIENAIDITDLNSGIYFLQLTSGNSKSTIKLLKQ